MCAGGLRHDQCGEMPSPVDTVRCRRRSELVSGDQYIQSLLQRYAVNSFEAKALAGNIAPVLQSWAGSQLNDLTFSGSFAKGTGNSISTDFDIFISLRSDTEALSEIYQKLLSLATRQGWTPRQQNVSIGITLAGKKIDLVPGRVQSGYVNYHSLYSRRTGTWTQTNVKMHIDTVTKSGRVAEIRAIKLWRDRHGLSFPSFALELGVIDALKGRSTITLAENVMYTLRDLSANIETRRLVDPANTNNVVSDDMSAAEKAAIAKQAIISATKRTWGEIIW